MSRFLGKFLHWFANTTDSPIEFGVMGGLSALSTVALGRRWLNFETPLHANIFGMIVGDSGVARKGTALNRAMSIIEAIEPERIGPNDYTSEALFQWMRDNKDPNTKKGREKIALFADEFGSDLARMGAYASTMKGDFCRLYDCVAINKVRIGRTLEIPKPRVTFMAACAYQMMIGGLNHNDWNTGYLMRFLYVAPLYMRPRFITTPPPQPQMKEDAICALQAIRDEMYGNPKSMTISGAAQALYSQAVAYHEYHMQQSNDVVKTYAGRFWTNVLKLALLYQLDEDPLAAEVSESAMRNAVDYSLGICWPSFITTFEKTGLTTFTNLVLIVSAILIEAGAKGVMRSALAARFMGRRELTDVMAWLKLNRMVRSTVVMRMSGAGGTDELLIWEN